MVNKVGVLKIVQNKLTLLFCRKVSYPIRMFFLNVVIVDLSIDLVTSSSEQLIIFFMMLITPVVPNNKTIVCKFSL